MDWDKLKVVLVLGGGFGYELSYVGFVGQGMLIVVVCGEVFVLLFVDVVFVGIFVVIGKVGCFVIVKNYIGDCLNFGFVVEWVWVFGFKVNMVIVDDDVVLLDLLQVCGVVGIFFVYKIVGVLVDQGSDLVIVIEVVEKVIVGVVFIGMFFDICILLGFLKEDWIGFGMVEFGFGIYGEVGVEQVVFFNVKLVMFMVVNWLELILFFGLYVVFLNNFGGMIFFEMLVLVEELIQLFIGG